MSPSGHAASPIQFGEYTLDLVRGALLRGSDEVKLRPKSYETLKYLALNAGRLIHKTELMTVLWPDSVSVSDDSVMQCIRDVRKALGEDAPQIIRTVPGRGYLFTATPVVTAASRVGEEVTDEPSGDTAAPPIPTSRLWAKRIGLAAVLLAGVVVLASWWKIHSEKLWLEERLPQIQQLAKDGRYVEAFELSKRAVGVAPADGRVLQLLNEVSDSFTVSTQPPGAEVFLQRLGSKEAERVGTTPFQEVRRARGEFVIQVRKPGYVESERTVSTKIPRLTFLNKTPWEIRLELALREPANTPRNMTFVPAGRHWLRGYSRGADATADLKEFLIDKYEVSNAEFKAFVDGGGYRKPEFWPSGKIAAGMHDKTGMPGPREWVAGTFAEGRQRYPVTGVSWEEASAFCRWQGKELPTIFEWEQAARGATRTPFGVTVPWGLLDGAVLSQRANFEGSGTAPVDAFAFGMSAYGAYNMAGNVSEWVRNRFDSGFATVGGSFRDPAYQFGHYGSRAAADSSETVGFRCVVPIGGEPEASKAPLSSQLPRFVYPVSTASQFQAAKALYSYEPAPLNAAVGQVRETDQWRREEISYDSNGERAKAYLYLPRNTKPPFQTIHFLSGDNWFSGVPVTDIVEGKAGQMTPYLRSGRALFLVVLKGFAGREPVGAYLRRDYGSTQRLGILKHWVVDMQRGMDYLSTRKDVDKQKIAFWNNSTYPEGAVIAALDSRYSAVVFMGEALGAEFQYVPPEVNPLFFFPHIRAPKLMMHGRYDDGHPESRSRPLFALMREPKKHVTFDGGHIAPPEITVPLVNPFLDQTLGRVALK